MNFRSDSHGDVERDFLYTSELILLISTSGQQLARSESETLEIHITIVSQCLVCDRKKWKSIIKYYYKVLLCET